MNTQLKRRLETLERELGTFNYRKRVAATSLRFGVDADVLMQALEGHQHELPSPLDDNGRVTWPNLQFIRRLLGRELVGPYCASPSDQTRDATVTADPPLGIRPSAEIARAVELPVERAL